MSANGGQLAPRLPRCPSRLPLGRTPSLGLSLGFGLGLPLGFGLLSLGPTGVARTARPCPRRDVCCARKRSFSCRNVHFALEEAQQFRHGIPSQLGLNMMVLFRSLMNHRESK